MKINKSVRLTLLAASTIATLALGYNMFSLWQKETLWGHRPLFFFLVAWASIVLLFWKKYSRHPKGLRWLGLSTLSAVLLALSFPPFPTTILLFIAWVPLLLIEYEVAKYKSNPSNESNSSNASIRPYLYNAFVLWNILVTWWVGNTAFIAGIVAIWLNAWFMYLPFWCFHKTRQRLPKLGYLPLIAYWLSFEYLHLNWEISWSWLTLGNAFAQFPQAVQWYEYTGVFGGSLWVMVVNVLVFRLLEKMEFRFSPKAALAQGWKLWRIKLIVLLPIAASLVWYFNVQDEGRDVEVAVIQPNFEPHYQKFKIPEREQMERFIILSEKAVTPNTKYVVWPETAFDGVRTEDLKSHPAMQVAQQFVDKHPGVKLVTGVSAYKVFAEGEPHTRNTRRIERANGNVIFVEVYNAALQLEAGQDSIPFYIKSKLVPGAEILPYHEVLFFLKPIVDQLDGSVEGHGTQRYREAFPSETGKVAPSICYESIFGEYNGGYIKAGAEAIFIMTNDGWWDDSGGHRQHLAYARLRAVETRKSIARSANTGTSCFINQRGDVQQPTDYEVEAAIRQNIKFNDRITFYVRWGDLIAKLAVLSTVLVLAYFLVNRLKQRA
ncbi:MAG: apolipoprotein N-acyltransferase [Saprospiraceae bacterium]|nr:apolipoprotein N-acyltransferase [Saprospiraceae bacterium]